MGFQHGPAYLCVFPSPAAESGAGGRKTGNLENPSFGKTFNRISFNN